MTNFSKLVKVYQQSTSGDPDLEAQALATLMIQTVFQHTDEGDLLHEHTIPAILAYINVDVMATALEIYEGLTDGMEAVTKH